MKNSSNLGTSGSGRLPEILEPREVSRVQAHEQTHEETTSP